MSDILSGHAYFFLYSSIPAGIISLRTGIRNPGVDVIGSMDVLSGPNGAAEIRVPHGHLHISELNHSLFAVALRRRMLAKQVLIAQTE